MHEKKGDTLGGYNDFIEKQKALTDDEASLSLIKFNTEVTVVHEIEPIDTIPALSPQTYSPGGGTALWDAVAAGVAMGEKKEATFDRMLCVIMTDGEENSSRKTTKEQVRASITSKEATGKWTFLYIGENPDQWSSDTGMSRMNAMSYCSGAERAQFGALDAAASQFRCSKKMQQSSLFKH